MTCRTTAFTAVAAVAVALLGASPADAAKTSLRYVALGDSYSAASGVLPPDLSAPLECLRSTRNYPKVVAATIGAQLTDVTCGAAETSHFFTPQYPGVPPQLDALKRNTQLVTMTIGGNDNNVFIDAILDCGSAGVLSLGQGSPCKDKYGPSFRHTLRTQTYPALVKTLKAVRKRSPHARVAILGYPWIMPPAKGCYPQMPVAAGDVSYVDRIQATLNNAVRRAAAKAHAIYVNMNGVSTGHDACQSIGVRWVEPALLGTNPVIVHPNALGEAAMAAQAISVLNLR
jgi:lysophospholipase L1-like esterase